MRHFGFALVLSVFATAINALELEESRFYPAEAETEVLRILSTADVGAFEPIIRAFQKQNPVLSIQYDVASSAEVMRGIYDEAAPYDLAISSAMDLQTKLANDGFAQKYVSDVTSAMPSWATWRDRVFAFTQEPAVLIISEAAFDGFDVPSNRQDLIDLLRDHPESFDGLIGTYDVRTSGLGYLFATQDSRNTESFWQLTEVMGRLNTRLYCCSGQMISDVAEGKLAIAYNVLGSYARLQETAGIQVVEMDDFVSVMMRTAIIPHTATSSATSGRMIDFLARLGDNPDLLGQTGLPSIRTSESQDPDAFRPIRLGPGLLVFLDRLRREAFLRNWTSSMEQR